MRGFFTWALAAYDQADAIVRMKARFMLSVNLILLLLILIPGPIKSGKCWTNSPDSSNFF